jgi:hypothetical protein
MREEEQMEKVRFVYLPGPARAVCLGCGADLDYDAPGSSVALVSESSAGGKSGLIGYFCTDCEARFTEERGETGFLREPVKTIHPAKAREALRRTAKKLRALARRLESADV